MLGEKVVEPYEEYLNITIVNWLAACKNLSSRPNFKGILYNLNQHLLKYYIKLKWDHWVKVLKEQRDDWKRKLPILLRIFKKYHRKLNIYCGFQRWKALYLKSIAPNQALHKIITRRNLKYYYHKWHVFSVAYLNKEFQVRQLVQLNKLKWSIQNWKRRFEEICKLSRLIFCIQKYHLQVAWIQVRTKYSPIEMNTSILKRNKSFNNTCDCIYKICTGRHCTCQIITHAKLRIQNLTNYIEYANISTAVTESVLHKNPMLTRSSKQKQISSPATPRTTTTINTPIADRSGTRSIFSTPNSTNKTKNTSMMRTNQDVNVAKKSSTKSVTNKSTAERQTSSGSTKKKNIKNNTTMLASTVHTSNPSVLATENKKRLVSTAVLDRDLLNDSLEDSLILDRYIEMKSSFSLTSLSNNNGHHGIFEDDQYQDDENNKGGVAGGGGSGRYERTRESGGFSTWDLSSFTNNTNRSNNK